jgi:hypothetical protein
MHHYRRTTIIISLATLIYSLRSKLISVCPLQAQAHMKLPFVVFPVVMVCGLVDSNFSPEGGGDTFL